MRSISGLVCFQIARVQALGRKYAPKHDDKGKEAKDVDERHDAFYERQSPEEHSVGEDSQE